MAHLLHRWGAFCARRAWIVIALWVAVLVAVGAGVSTLGAQTSNDLTLPGTGSQSAKDLLTEKFPPQQNGANPIVFAVKTGKLTDADNTRAVNAAVDQIGKQPHVHSVTNPLSSQGQTAGLLSKDQQTAFAPVLMDVGSGDLTEEIAGKVLDATQPARDAGITTAAGGSIGSTLSTDESETSEIVGIVAAMLILSLVLGSLVAMGLPIVTAIVGLAAALGTVGLAGHLLAIPASGPTLATMIGLGVGIDYALFLITRHQDQLRDGMPMAESIATAVATSGSAIVFAGSTVVVALLALSVAGIPLVSALGLASAVAVVAAVLVAVSLLPAFLGLLGPRIAWASLPAFKRSKRAPGHGMWAGWARFVRRHPWPVALGSLALLVPLILPVFTLELGQEDIGATSPETTERQAYDLIAEGMGVGYNGPLQVASEFDPPAAPSDEYTQKYDQATEMKKDLEEKQKDLPEQQKELEARQADLEQEQASLEEQGAELEREQAVLERQVNELRAQQADLERQADALRAQQRKLEAEQSQLEAQRAQLRREAERLAKKIRPLARELARLVARERVLERRIDEAQQRGDDALVASLQARLERVNDRQAVVRRQLAPLEKQARGLAAQARRLLAKAQRLQDQADELQREADELNRRKSSLTSQAASLEAQGQRLQAQAAELQRQAAALQQQAADLQSQADELKAQQKDAQQEQQQAEKLQDELTQMMTAAGGDERATDTRVVALQSALSGTDGVTALTPPQVNKSGDVVLLAAVPSTAPASDDTADLVSHVRDSVLPEVNGSSGVTSYVGGFTASYVDLAALISARLLLVIGTVILLGCLLLMVAFRSLLIPVQAAVTNLLSAAAAFGVLTAAFQWGWGIDLLGIDTADSSVPIASYVPLMMFAGLFGLSMDYEVFLVSHLQQHVHQGEEPKEAVPAALASSARITTAAALIMASVFASFILDGDPTIKQFGVGLSVAVLLAGILVVTLAPAALVIFGRAAWWLPRWLDRILPHISIEGETKSPAPARPVTGGTRTGESGLAGGEVSPRLDSGA